MPKKTVHTPLSGDLPTYYVRHFTKTIFLRGVAEEDESIRVFAEHIVAEVSYLYHPKEQRRLIKKLVAALKAESNKSAKLVTERLS